MEGKEETCLPWSSLAFKMLPNSSANELVFVDELPAFDGEAEEGEGLRLTRLPLRDKARLSKIF